MDKKTKSKNPKAEKSDKKKPQEENSDFRQLVRVSGVVLDGNKKISRALLSIKGVGYNTCNSLLTVTGIDKDVKLGNLTEAEVESLEENLRTIHEKLPTWMINRRSDYDTGKDIHLIVSDLDIANREDITRHKKMKSYKGIMHILGQPVRGQRTRTSFRRGSTIGVSRKKAGK